MHNALCSHPHGRSNSQALIGRDRLVPTIIDETLILPNFEAASVRSPEELFASHCYGVVVTLALDALGTEQPSIRCHEITPVL